MLWRITLFRCFFKVFVTLQVVSVNSFSFQTFGLFFRSMQVGKGSYEDQRSASANHCMELKQYSSSADELIVLIKMKKTCYVY